MNDPRETLNRIRNQANNATEGPWVGIRYPDGLLGRVIVSGELGVCIAEDFPDDADAEFIAHARTDVPWLLEQVGLRDKALEAVLELHKDGGESQGYLDDGSYGDMPHCCTECGSLGEYGVPWPCPTVEAITTALEAIK